MFISVLLSFNYLALGDFGEVKTVLFCQGGEWMSVGHLFVWDIEKI